MYKLSLSKGGDSKDHSHHAQMDAADLDWNSLVTSITTSGWTPALYNGSRASENFIQAQMIGIDYDDGNPSLEQARFLFKDYKHIIYTTKSHQIAKGNKEACDRFRVVLFFEKVIENEKDYKKVCNIYKTKFADDQACHTSARYFAPGKLVSEKETGKILEVIMLNENQQRALAYIKQMGQSIEGEGGDVALAKACRYLRNDFALSFDESKDVILEWDLNNKPPWQYKHMGAIEAKLRDAIKYADPNKTGRLAKQEVTKIETSTPISSVERRSRSEENKKRRNESKIQLLPDLNVYIHPNGISIFGAMSKGGKTTTTSNIVGHVLNQQKRVLIISNEMCVDDILDKIDPVCSTLDNDWDSGKLVAVDKQDLDFNDPNITAAFILNNLTHFDFILLDQLSYLEVKTDKKHLEYEAFVRNLANAQLKNQGQNSAHIMLTQQLTRDAKERLGDKHATWTIQNFLADCSSTIKPASIGFIYSADYNTGIGKLKVDAIRYPDSVPNPVDTASQWLWQNGKLVRVDDIARSKG